MWLGDKLAINPLHTHTHTHKHTWVDGMENRFVLDLVLQMAAPTDGNYLTFHFRLWRHPLVEPSVSFRKQVCLVTQIARLLYRFYDSSQREREEREFALPFLWPFPPWRNQNPHPGPLSFPPAYLLVTVLSALQALSPTIKFLTSPSYRACISFRLVEMARVGLH